jgi:hypothetical protein
MGEPLIGSARTRLPPCQLVSSKQTRQGFNRLRCAAALLERASLVAMNELSQNALSLGSGSLPKASRASADSRRCECWCGLAAKLRWSRHAPARHDQFTLTIRTLRTIGANWSGKIPGNAGRLPVQSWTAPNRFGGPLVSILRQSSIVPDHDTQPNESGRQVGRSFVLKVRQVNAAGRLAFLRPRLRTPETVTGIGRSARAT